jgi:predicted nucleotidyltransferase component of viral defense system
MSDMGASILARLKNSAREKGISYQQCLQLFFQEEFLRKLAMSKYVDSLVLKGGLFIYTLTDFRSRATIDVDFLLREHSNSIEEVEKMVQEILDIRTGNYFITMTANGFEKISPQRKYNGISTQIIGKIKNVRVPFNVDIGVGDVIVPKAEYRQIHTQLEDFDTPTIATYSLESTIAEKLDVILQRYELTGRMKDFYDIYYLSKTFDFEGQKLQTAIYETLQNRGTPYEKDSFTRVTELKNDPGMQTKWRFFLRTIKSESLSFADVIDVITEFLQPVFGSLLAEEEWQKGWDSKTEKWGGEGSRLVPVPKGTD